MKIECFFRGVIKINNSFIGEKMGGSGRRGEVVFFVKDCGSDRS